MYCLCTACCVLQLARVLTGLTSLSLVDTPGLSMSGVRDIMSSLVHLDLSRCQSVTSATLQPALDTCLALQTLSLDSCYMLTSLKLTMPAMQVGRSTSCRQSAVWSEVLFAVCCEYG